MQKRWNIAPVSPLDFATQVQSEPVVAQLLWNRGLKTLAEAQDFFNPTWEAHLHDPTQFRHLPQATTHIFEALQARQTITVHGDYDADGVTGSTVLITTLREIEKKLLGEDVKTVIDFYIPHREKEGYGLQKATVPKLKDRGTSLIITVDCGIACVGEIALANEQGMKVIVVDHHQFGDSLPEAALIHPGLPEETYPFKKLAAVGVAFKLACALLDEARRRGLAISEGWEKWLLDLVAIATVTDVVPLIGENRLLETYGLRVLNKTRRPGLKALIDRAGLELGKLDTESIGFGIGPRLNAAGRMDHASIALNLMLAETDEDAKRLADDVERCNKARQDATKQMMTEADEILFARYGDNPAAWPPILTLWDERWSPSLVGLAAGRYMEKYGRPVAIVGYHEGTWIGSGRSFSFFDITAAVGQAGEGLLLRHGGHVQACGFSFGQRDHIPVFADKLQALAESKLKAEDLMPLIEVDAEIPLSAINWNLVETVQQFAPFGEGNRKPIFLSRKCPIVQSTTIGQNNAHLRLQILAPNGLRLGAIGFKMGAEIARLPHGTDVDLVYNLDINEWQGRRDIQLKLIDVKPSN